MAGLRRAREAIRRQWRRAFVWLFVIGFLAVAAGLLYFGTPFHGSQASVQAVQANDDVTVHESGGTYVLEPAGGDTETGLVFYPGARVAPDAYLSSLAPVVSEANVAVVVPRMPFNLAVLDQGAAGRVIDRRDDIERWYVGGHSLGGAMACRYARSNPDRLEGVVLFGAYCDRSVDGTGLRVLSVAGEADTVLNQEAYRRNLANLPEDATVRTLPGVNHTQFGSYTGQSGDEPSGTTYETAHRRLANVTVPWLTTFSRSGSPTANLSRQKHGEKGWTSLHSVQ